METGQPVGVGQVTREKLAGKYQGCKMEEAMDTTTLEWGLQDLNLPLLAMYSSGVSYKEMARLTKGRRWLRFPELLPHSLEEEISVSAIRKMLAKNGPIKPRRESKWEARMILERWQGGERMSDMAREYGVSPVTIRTAIISVGKKKGLAWDELPGGKSVGKPGKL